MNTHNAVRICIEETCKEPALICNQQTEDCKKKHAKCLMSIPVDIALSKLLFHGQLAEIIDKEILTYLDQVLKTVTIQREEYLKQM